MMGHVVAWLTSMVCQLYINPNLQTWEVKNLIFFYFNLSVKKHFNTL